MKAIVTILDDNDNVVEKDKLVLPTKSYTTIIKGEGGEGGDRMRIDKHEFSFMYSIMKPFEGRCLM